MKPLNETPIYAELMREYEVQAAINSGRRRPIDRYTFTRTRLHNGRKPR